MTPREFSERLAKRARRANITLDPQAAESLGAYYRLLEFWNEKVNLTAFSLNDAPDEAIDRLLIEPLVAARHLLGAPGGTARTLARTRACSTSARAAALRPSP